MYSLKLFGIDGVVLGLYPTGSYYICNPPVEDTDRDFLVLCEDLRETITLLLKDGWESCVDDEGQADFYTEEQEYGIRWTAYRKGIYNLMITEDSNWYYASVIATEYCRIFNIQDKEHRIRIFRFLKYKEALQAGDIPHKVLVPISKEKT
jgi:hypothetical protein